MRSDRDRLRDILSSIEKIGLQAVRGREVFEEDELVQIWIVYHLQVIGEASNQLRKRTRDQAPGVPWQKIRGMRNLLVHEYFGVDLDIVWDAVSVNLPPLKLEVERMLRELDR